MTSYPEDYPADRLSGGAFAVLHVRDIAGVIRKVLDIIPRLPYELFVEVKYLDRILNFTGMC